MSIQIIDKSTGAYQLYQTIGSSSEPIEIEKLYQQAKCQIASIGGLQELPFQQNEEDKFVDTFINGIQNLELTGPELLLGKLFDEIGFNQIKQELFRHLVITRLVYPVSKLKTTDYLFKYKGIRIDVVSIYRYLDKLHQNQMDQVQQISYEHTVQILGQTPSLVFYDVTTLYFEAEQEDDFRKNGFSKDGKHSQPQIVLGLLVSAGGYPITYQLFEGNQFEGHTMLPVLESFKEKYNLENIIVVADAGLLSDKNIKAICEKNYQYIIAARIKSESEEVKKAILAFGLQDKQNHSISKTATQKLIISYSTQRAKKDKFNRERGVAKLEKSIKSGQLTKQHINNRGFNKYLKLNGKIKITLDKDKCQADAKWDGLKGYLTNTSLYNDEVIKQYTNLWEIEKTFRISKTDLRIRPIFHHLKRRIEAHICIAFAACKLYKELERQLQERKAGISPEKAIDILKTIYQITIKSPYSNLNHNRLLLKNDEQVELLKIFNLV